MHPVQIASSRNLSNENLSQSFPKERVVRAIAIETLTELAAALLITGIVCAFVATPLSYSVLLGALLIQTSVNLFARIVRAYAAKKMMQNQSFEGFWSRVEKIASWIPPTSFALGTALNGQTLIHEAGHVLATKVVFKNCKSSIQVFPFVGGETSYTFREISFFGKILGKQGSKGFVAAGGPLFSLLISSIALISSRSLKEKHPKMSRYLKALGVLDFVIHIRYALSAANASPTDLSHDFVRLSQLGIHYKVAALIMCLGLIALSQNPPQKEEEFPIFSPCPV